MNAPDDATPDAIQERRRQLAPGYAAGVDEAMIAKVVHAFYARVRQDPTLGPIFSGAIDDWDEHLAKLCDFWSSVLLMSGRFKGSPMAAHMRVEGIQSPHFGRWLELFHATARQLCPPPAAALFVERSAMIGQSLQLGLAASRGELPAVRTP